LVERKAAGGLAALPPNSFFFFPAPRIGPFDLLLLPEKFPLFTSCSQAPFFRAFDSTGVFCGRFFSPFLSPAHRFLQRYDPEPQLLPLFPSACFLKKQLFLERHRGFSLFLFFRNSRDDGDAFFGGCPCCTSFARGALFPRYSSDGCHMHVN